MRRKSQNTSSATAPASPQKQAEAMLEGFFQVPGNIALATVEATPDSPVATCAQVWIEGLRQPADDGQLRLVVLPRLSGGRVQWYGIAFNSSQARDLREQITAFAGPTLSTFRGEGYDLDPSDPREAVLSSVQPVSVVRFQGGDSKNERESLADALALMSQVRASAQVRSSELLLSTSQVLREFYMALAASDRAEAEDQILYLRRHNRLDALNLQFLEVQMRAILGVWREIVELPMWPQLVQARRPLAVTRALGCALYNIYLSPHEASGDAAALQRAFREEVWPQRGSLLSARAGMTTPEILKLFVLRALHEQDAALRDDIALAFDKAEPPLPPEQRTFWDVLAATLPGITAPVPQDLQAEAQAALDAGDFDRALALGQDAPPSMARTVLLLHCAFELESPHSQSTAVQAVQALPPHDLDSLLQVKLNRTFWQQLTGTAPSEESAVQEPTVASVPTNWSEWLDAAGSTGRSDAWIDVSATRGADAWSLEPLLDADQVQVLEDKLNAATTGESAKRRLMSAMPHLLRYFERDPDFPRPHLRSIYDQLRSLLAYEGSTASKSEWAVYADWCRVVLELGLTPSGYSDLLDETEELWKNRLAPSNLDPALDLLDVLLLYPVHNSERRLALAQVVLSRIPLWITNNHIEPETWRLCQQLAADYGLSELLSGVQLRSQDGEDQEQDDPLLSLAGKTVAIYTLSPNVANRARDIITNRCGCEIKLNDDLVGTTELAHLAKNSDVFVMVTASAKHAATEFIEANRLDKNTLLRVHARGSSSIVRQLSAFAASVEAASGIV